jgi:predicted metal-dependent peptidase
MNYNAILDDLSYGNQVEKLCYRILKLMECREDKTLNCPACVANTNQQIILKYNSNLISSFNEFKFVLKHEALHVIFGDLFLNFKNYDLELLNIALDARINTYILFDRSKFTSILDFEENKYFSGIDNIMQKATWEACYEALKKQKRKNSNNKKDSNGGLSNNSFIDKIKPIDKHEWQENDVTTVVHETIIQEQIEKGMEEIEINIGSEFGQEIVSGLEYFRVPRDKWRKQLTSSIISLTKIKDYYDTYSRFNRRLYDLDFRLPAKKAVYYPTIATLIDTSNSMSQLIPKVLGHIATISNENGVIDYLIAGDTDVRIFMKNVKKTQIANLQFEGFGGTILSPLINKAFSLHNIDITILITDFYISNYDINKIKTYIKKRNTILCVPKTSKDLIKKQNLKCKIVYVD